MSPPASRLDSPTGWIRSRAHAGLSPSTAPRRWPIWLEIADQPGARRHPRVCGRGRPSSPGCSRCRQLIEDGLWPPKDQAIQNLEQSLRDNRPRSLVQMATGSGKTFTAIIQTYRLLKFGGARRILFLVDRGNLADQTYKEFSQYTSPVQQLQVHRRIHRPAPAEQHHRHHRPGLHLHHPAPVLHAQQQGDARRRTMKPPSPAWSRCSSNSRRSNTTRTSPSRPSTSSSPMNVTAPSTTSGPRCWSTSTPI